MTILLILRKYQGEMYKLQSDSVMVPFRHSACVYLMIYDSLSWCLMTSGFIYHMNTKAIKSTELSLYDYGTIGQTTE